RPVGVTFFEGHDDLVSDARDVNGSPPLTRPGRPDADPAGAVRVVSPLAVPVELDLHPAVLVGEDLLAGWPDHDGGLGPLAHGLRGGPGGTVRRSGGDAFESVAVRGLGPQAGTVVAPRASLMVDVEDDVAAVGVEMPAHCEPVPAGEMPAVTGPGDD